MEFAALQVFLRSVCTLWGSTDGFSELSAEREAQEPEHYTAFVLQLRTLCSALAIIKKTAFNLLLAAAMMTVSSNGPGLNHELFKNHLFNEALRLPSQLLLTVGPLSLCLCSDSSRSCSLTLLELRLPPSKIYNGTISRVLLLGVCRPTPLVSGVGVNMWPYTSQWLRKLLR